MSNRNLQFHPLTETRQQAILNLDCGYRIQITNDFKEKSYECILFDAKGSIVDNEEGCTYPELDAFIERSESLVETYKEIMEDSYATES